MKAATVLGVLLLRIAAAYDCPASACGAGCVPASPLPPGDLPPESVPMFITLTNDDALTVVTAPIILNITDRHSSPNGCPIPPRARAALRMPCAARLYFISVDYTDPVLVQQAYLKGHEIATHTLNHPSNPNFTQIAGAKLWLNQTAKIPLEDIVGYRQPFLLFSPDQRRILYNNGFSYDSSISEGWSPRNPLSPSAAERMWPYTLDCGVAQDCTVSTGTCSAAECYPSMFEYNLWDTQYENGTIISSMDPQSDDVFGTYKREFDARYNGTRTPLGIFVHAAWLKARPDHLDAINQFIEYALSFDDVYLATVKQVVDYMRNPVQADEYEHPCPSAAELQARLPGGRVLCGAPAAGCGHGVFSVDACACQCQQEFNASANGYCMDASGYCSVPKVWDASARVFKCETSYAVNPATAPTRPADQGVSFGAAACGHALAEWTGLDTTGAGDRSARYALALKAVDDSCDTCTTIAPSTGGNTSTFAILLAGVANVTGARLLTGAAANITVSIANSSLASVELAATATPCAQAAEVPAGTPTVISCAAVGSLLFLSSPQPFTLCDAFPVVAAPAPTTPVAGTFIAGTTVDAFKSNGAGVVCSALVAMTGDANATCELVSAVANGAQRRRLQQASSTAASAGSIHVVLRIWTSDPALALRIFSNGDMLVSLLTPLGISLNPSTVTVVAETLPTDASSSPVPSAPPAAGAPAAGSGTTGAGQASGGGGSSTNVGAIVGGVVGGVVGAAALAGAVAFLVIRRRKASSPVLGMPAASSASRALPGPVPIPMATVVVHDGASPRTPRKRTPFTA